MKQLIVLCAFAGCLAPAFGSPILGVFSPPTGSQGQSHNYVLGGYTVNAQAFGPNSPNLYGKNGGTGEIGVGLTNDPTGDHEITAGSFIQLDLTDILAFGPFTITMGSTTDGETWRISQQANGFSGTIGGCVSTCWTGTSDSPVVITPTLANFRYLDISVPDNAHSWNVLLSSIAFNDGGKAPPTPESVSFVLAGSGLIGMYFIRRRRPGSR